MLWKCGGAYPQIVNMAASSGLRPSRFGHQTISDYEEAFSETGAVDLLSGKTAEGWTC